jgi:hypothetical protein
MSAKFGKLSIFATIIPEIDMEAVWNDYNKSKPH